MNSLAWENENTKYYPGSFDSSFVKIVGWEYSLGGDEVLTSDSMPSHYVVWMRPIFGKVEKEEE